MVQPCCIQQEKKTLTFISCCFLIALKHVQCREEEEKEHCRCIKGKTGWRKMIWQERIITVGQHGSYEQKQEGQGKMYYPIKAHLSDVQPSI